MWAAARLDVAWLDAAHASATPRPDGTSMRSWGARLCRRSPGGCTSVEHALCLSRRAVADCHGLHVVGRGRPLSTCRPSLTFCQCSLPAPQTESCRRAP